MLEEGSLNNGCVIQDYNEKLDYHDDRKFKNYKKLNHNNEDHNKNDINLNKEGIN